ncbi:MAG: LuxR C-terminal-related transcriptional regulator [Rikenellaceae bacterium]
MGGRVHILVVEPSSIIRCGIVTLLQRATLPNITIAESDELVTMSNRRASEIPDLLIVNSSYLGLFSPSQLRADIGNENLKLLGLQSAFIDQSTLSYYDDVISIHDSIDTIKGKIQNLTKESGDSAVGKKELSQREKEIIVCVVKGMTNKQMADALCLSSHTIIAHRRNIANKLQIHSPSGLTIYAIVNKLVDLTDIQNSIMQETEEGY